MRRTRRRTNGVWFSSENRTEYIWLASKRRYVEFDGAASFLEPCKCAMAKEARLWEELGRLQEVLGCGYDLKLVWTPTPASNLEGEVKGCIVYIYSGNLKTALKTLRHEFLDYAVSQLIEPYKGVTNALIALINKQAYARKEKLVESLVRLFTSQTSTEDQDRKEHPHV